MREQRRQNADNTIGPAALSGRESRCHFPLHHQDRPVDELSIIETGEEKWAGDLVREVPDQEELIIRKRFQPLVERSSEDISLDDGDICQVWIITEILRQSPIDFNSGEPLSPVGKQACQNPFAWSYLENGSALRRDGIHDPFGDGRIMQEMLTERRWASSSHDSRSGGCRVDGSGSNRDVQYTKGIGRCSFSQIIVSHTEGVRNRGSGAGDV